ncbi:MAG: hypothetical protein AAGA73_11995 [Pseudomonadota bacterium]
MLLRIKALPSRSMVMLALLVALCACGSGPELRLTPETTSPASLLEGKRLLDQGKAAEAVSAIRKHFRENGADLHGLNALAIAYAELGRVDLAADMFGRALALKPDDPATLNNIGFAALRRADSKLARRYLEEARRYSDGLDEIDGNLKRLHLLEMIERTRSRSTALRPAAWHSPDQQAQTVIRLPKGAPPVAPKSISTKPFVAPSPAKPILIDFMTVTDPFTPNAATK